MWLAPQRCVGRDRSASAREVDGCGLSSNRAVEGIGRSAMLAWWGCSAGNRAVEGIGRSAMMAWWGCSAGNREVEGIGRSAMLAWWGCSAGNRAVEGCGVGAFVRKQTPSGLRAAFVGKGSAARLGDN